MLGLDQDLIVGYRGVPGNVLQVVNATYSTPASSSTTTFADTGITATITPTSASSKVLVLVNQNGCRKDAVNTWMYLRLLRGGTNILDFERIAVYTNSAAVNAVGSCSLCYLDSPSTTSAVTYKTQFASANGASVSVQAGDGGINSASTITLMEIAA